MLCLRITVIHLLCCMKQKNKFQVSNGLGFVYSTGDENLTWWAWGTTSNRRETKYRFKKSSPANRRHTRSAEGRLNPRDRSRLFARPSWHAGTYGRHKRSVFLSTASVRPVPKLNFSGSPTVRRDDARRHGSSTVVVVFAAPSSRRRVPIASRRQQTRATATQHDYGGAMFSSLKLSALRSKKQTPSPKHNRKSSSKCERSVYHAAPPLCARKPLDSDAFVYIAYRVVVS